MPILAWIPAVILLVVIAFALRGFFDRNPAKMRRDTREYLKEYTKKTPPA